MECRICGRKFDYKNLDNANVARHFRIPHGLGRDSLLDDTLGYWIKSQAQQSVSSESQWVKMYSSSDSFVSFELLEPEYTHCNDCGGGYPLPPLTGVPL